MRSVRSIVIGPTVTWPKPGLFAGSGPPSHMLVFGCDSGIAIDNGSTCSGTPSYGKDVVMLVFASGSFCERKSRQIAVPFVTPYRLTSDWYNSALETSPPPPTAKIDCTSVAVAMTSVTFQGAGKVCGAGYSAGRRRGSVSVDWMYPLTPST